MMKKFSCLALACFALLCLPARGADSLLMSVNLGDTEVISNFDTQQTYQALANYLGKAIGAQVKLVVGQNATAELQRTRTGYYAVMVAPAHVIGSALKYDYEPVAKMPGSNKAVFVATKASNITRLEQARGKRLGLPAEDSLATYLAKGELNAAGIQAKTFFKSIKYSRYQDSLLFSLGIGQVDVAAVDEAAARKWLAQNPGVVFSESQAVPALSVAVNTKLPPAQQEKMRLALLQLPSNNPELLKQMHISALEPAQRKDFDYVETLGYFTPKLLPGATVVTAQQAKEMMDKGAILFDTRVEHEYKESHIKGAISLPYKENSAKEVDFNADVDSWDVSKLPPNKSTSIILACNGPECWKSYKSAKLAIGNKYTKVYWFRGGYPEWKAAGYAVE
jgi:ABC-type phosphate/phosphonate transport system substrate-binding protein/rhodanese-related sulfurtransferase